MAAWRGGDRARVRPRVVRDGELGAEEASTEGGVRELGQEFLCRLLHCGEARRLWHGRWRWRTAGDEV